MLLVNVLWHEFLLCIFLAAVKFIGIFVYLVHYLGPLLLIVTLSERSQVGLLVFHVNFILLFLTGCITPLINAVYIGVSITLRNRCTLDDRFFL